MPPTSHFHLPDPLIPLPSPPPAPPTGSPVAAPGYIDAFLVVDEGAARPVPLLLLLLLLPLLMPPMAPMDLVEGGAKKVP